MLRYNILKVVRKNPGCDIGVVADGLGIDIDVEKILGENRDGGYITYDEVDGLIENIHVTELGNEIFYQEWRMKVAWKVPPGEAAYPTD